MGIKINATDISNALQLAVDLESAFNAFVTKGLPVLNEAGQVIQHMQEQGVEIPSLEDIQKLRTTAQAADAAAQAAIDAKRNTEGQA